MRRAESTRKFKGFAVLDGSGKLVWGTIRKEAAEAEDIFKRWNPAITDYEVKYVEITIGGPIVDEPFR